MKTIVRTMLFIVTLALLSQCDNDEPNPNITIPDDNFLNALIELGVDTNGDGIISPEEAEAITNLVVGSASISDMTGIEAFVNLDTLYCASNQLTSLDLSNNPYLVYLYCDYNKLTTLDVSNNISLEFLTCGENLLSNLDVLNNTNISMLFCSENQLKMLDVSNNISLEGLSCDNNKLASLDVSKNSNLK